MIPMLQNVLQNLFGAPATRAFPQARREPFALARGTVGFQMEKCNFCGLCAMRCPSRAITVSKADKELAFEPFRCIMCGACAESCAKGCAQMLNVAHSPVAIKPRQVHKKAETPPVAQPVGPTPALAPPAPPVHAPAPEVVNVP